ncbi:Poly(rC)-binding protein 4 [Geodia barretti]|uniref:Poly(RC)-binding protein 4 n=1 Tax=Geodia barretti TaxID=519541 RepID=A0AA35U188_GEOBA|nr:Poly(rC)-binding protein 4 [Geodia barretti]
MEKIGSSCAATSTGASSVGMSAGVVGGELSGAGGQLDGDLELHVDGSLLVGEDAAGAGAAGEDDVLVTEPVLGIRMLMSSRDVGSIIGKGGMTIKAFREQSGARINISSSTSSERLVTVTGNRENICRAFAAIGKQIEQNTLQASAQENADKSEEGGVTETLPPVATPDTPLTISFRLVIQSSQCGSLIGKGGTKIKEIRETTGVSIQVAGETLPNSTERAVTISGIYDALVVCVGLICNVMLENPPRGPFIPYKPHSLPNQAYQPRTTPNATAGPYTATGPATTTQQMRIPNDLIGCVIGRKGSKIHEIRVSSGAQIKIAGNEGDGGDRLVTITGTPEAVGMAQYLINSRIHSEVNSFITMGTSMSV